jgi:hypothetical protein
MNHSYEPETNWSDLPKQTTKIKTFETPKTTQVEQGYRMEEINENRQPLNTTLMHINIVMPTMECLKEMHLGRDVQEAKRITCG